ncbi:MAG: hypothetical protein HXY38_04405 [Chloroflexi bacterium]|nr:hypothetical protein [Chloroflexota bacterium]
MKNVFSKLMMAALALALVFAAIPATQVFAQGQLTDEKLEQAWARARKAYERMGKGFEDIDAHVAKIQGMIDKAAENGKDVSALQTALDAYADALTAAKPDYDALGEVFAAHAGFDADGKVVDSDQALATLQQVRDEMKSIKESMGGTFKALREALKAFREANEDRSGKGRDS